MHTGETGSSDTRISNLEALVERQMGMLGRYDDIVGELTRHASPGNSPGPRIESAIDRALALLDQAIAKAEKLTSDNRALEEQLGRTVVLLEDSLRNQEAMAGMDRGRSAAPEDDAREALEETLAKYDRMLERSLAALEDAYRASESSKKEIGDRDKLLSRTLDLLQAAVEGEQQQRKQTVLGRLFS